MTYEPTCQFCNYELPQKLDGEEKTKALNWHMSDHDSRGFAEITIAFDIDGTLISNTNGLGKEHLNIDIYNILVLLSKMKNTRIIVWSGGGKDYAEQIVQKYGLTKWVSEVYAKQEYDESINGIVDLAFDDIHSFRMAHKNIIVRTK